ncbi:MAG TPA: hypothetical protein VFA54_00950 [Bryobacterales bacterium]|jgi:hypothetical protein|nr:hypothetical protein [Bryobacterales bacterium]
MVRIAALVAVSVISCASAQTPVEDPACSCHGSPAKVEKTDCTQAGDTIAGKQAFLHAAAVTAEQEIRNSPDEWGRGIPGVGKRFASVFGKHLIKSGVQLGVARLLHENLGYCRSQKSGFRARLNHALVSAVMGRSTRTGNATPAVGRFSGAITSGFVSRTWQPARLRTASGGIASAGVSLGADAGANVVREFWPEIRRFFGRRSN